MAQDKNRIRKTYSFFRPPPILASGGGGGGGGGGCCTPELWFSTTDDAIYTTGSVLIRGADATDAAQDYGTDTWFFVSGSIAGNGSERKVSAFGGDVVVSGSLTAFNGLSGSLTQLPDGTSYLIAGIGIDIVSASNGGVTISSKIGGGDVYTDDFVDGDLNPSNILVVNHSLQAQYVNVSVYDENDKLIIPDEAIATAPGTIEIDLTSFRPLPGTWHVFVASGQAPGYEQYWFSTTAGSIFTSGSAALVGDGDEWGVIDSPSDKGADVFFYVSGSISGTGVEDKKSLFGGDVIISGSLKVGTGSITITSNDIQWSGFATRIEKSGNDMKFYDVNVPAGATLSSLIGGGSTPASPVNSVQYNAAGAFGGSANFTYDGDLYLTSSFSQGLSSKAMGSHSHAEGDSTTTIGGTSHSEGIGTIAFGDYSHAEGSGARSDGAGSHAEGFGPTASGDYSHAEGEYTETVGIASHAEGQYSLASGDYSHAEGFFATGSNLYSHAEGQYSLASGQGSHAEGTLTEARGESSHAEGWQTLALSDFSHAEGQYTTASALYSHAEGYYSVAASNFAHAEGWQTVAFGGGSHAEGQYTRAAGGGSHAEGYLTTASVSWSHAEGYQTLTEGLYSHAEGRQTLAQGYYSHAEGYLTTASAYYSHAGGLRTTAAGQYQTVVGRWNDSDVSSDTLFIVGNGASAVDKRHKFKVTANSNIFHQNAFPVDTSAGSQSTYPVLIKYNPLIEGVWGIGLDSSFDLHFSYGLTTLDTKGYLDHSTNEANLDFTGQHRSIPETGNVSDFSDKIGLIVVATGDYNSLTSGSSQISINESLPIVRLSTSRNQKSVFGVVSDHEDPNETSRKYLVGNWGSVYTKRPDDNRLIINSLGEGGIWICNINGNLENGDYVTTCEIPGMGMKQDDDLLHNYTVAKITCDCDFDLGSTLYRCEEFEHEGVTYRRAFVGCTYHCG